MTILSELLMFTLMLWCEGFRRRRWMNISPEGAGFSVHAMAPLIVWKKGLRFAGSVLGFVEFGAVDEDFPAPQAQMEP
jgi:hypothetical protein